MASPQPDLRIGTSGYQYDHWRGVFYPEDLLKSRWFAHYAQHFDTVEINNTFYGLPQPSAFEHWREQASQASHASQAADADKHCDLSVHLDAVG